MNEETNTFEDSMVKLRELAELLRTPNLDESTIKAINSNMFVILADMSTPKIIVK